MSRRELVIKAINGEPVERVPVAFWHHFLPDETEINSMLPGQEGLVDKLIAGHKEFIDTFHPDLVKIMSDGFFHFPMDGDEHIKSLADLDRLIEIDASHPWIRRQVEFVKKVTAMQSDTLYFYNIFTPLTMLRWIGPTDLIIDFIKNHSDKLVVALEKVARGMSLLMKSVVQEGGADGFYFSVQNPDVNRVTDDEYRKLITPSDRIALNAAHEVSKFIILHICGYGGQRNRMEFWKDYPATIYNWAVHVEKFSLTQGKALFPGKCVLGGFANPPGCLLEKGTREELEAETKKIIAEVGTRGIIIGADCSLPMATPTQHFIWIRDQAAKL